MEKRKNFLNNSKLCRFCLTQDDSLQNIYDVKSNTAMKKDASLPMKILSCISVEVFPSDRMPCFICQQCSFFMELFYGFKSICRQADETILKYIQNGTALEPPVWPNLLTQVFRNRIKQTDKHVVQTVIEGGATVEVTSRDTDSEEEDESVYNVKIDDGNESSARIKVIAAKSNQDAKSNAKQGFATVSKLTRHVRTHAGARAYPCKYCDKSFMKSHHYTRHIRLRHRAESGPGVVEQFRCEQCEDTFVNQDELIYHSAIHATQNLTCPLCQEKFEDVDAVTVHIKSHVNGTEFQCDFCELVFTSKEKLKFHLHAVHEEEVQDLQDEDLNNESSMDMDNDDEDSSIKIKEEDGQMVVEIKKADNFMLPTTNEVEEEEKINTHSEESESEATFMELSSVDILATPNKEAPLKQTVLTATKAPEPAVNTAPSKQTPKSKETANNSQTASILRKAEEIKRKVKSAVTMPEKKEKPKAKVESSTSGGASDKSLRLLEKELQELKRTTVRNDTNKIPPRISEPSRKRPQLHATTPKLRSADEKKPQTNLRSSTANTEKKVPEKRAVKENKEPKESKELKVKDEKEQLTSNSKEEKETKENDTPKSAVKNAKPENGPSDKSPREEGVRRSTRPSKIKDYAKMIRERFQANSGDDDDSDDGDEEYVDGERTAETRKGRRKGKQLPKPAAKSTPINPRKRGRPRKEPTTGPPLHPQVDPFPPKMRRENIPDETEGKSPTTEQITKEDTVNENKPVAPVQEDNIKSEENAKSEENTQAEENQSSSEKDDSEVKSSDRDKNTEGNATEDDKVPPADPKLASQLIVSPTGQTLKKVPIKALPPGIKPLPLPATARPMGPSEMCEMQIGKKVVKVQKIVMTKAEVEAMAKKGLLEMKDGTMVLKQGIKLPTSDPAAIKSSLVGVGVSKESPSKQDKPTRCDIDEEAS